MDDALRMDFASYGVRVSLRSNDDQVFAGIAAVARRSLLDQIDVAPLENFDHIFEMNRQSNGDLMLTQNGVELGASDTQLKAYRFFDSILRVSVGESSPDLVFVHAGVVGWRGKAILMPADSFKGKSTLVTELVRAGAEYYSDDFAIIDADGLVSPFPRKISMRSEDFKTYELTPEELGGEVGSRPIPIGTILVTEFAEEAQFSPVLETPGAGLLKMIPFTLSMRQRPDFAMKVLHKATRHAIIISTLRGSADRFAKTLLDFVDNHVN